MIDWWGFLSADYQWVRLLKVFSRWVISGCCRFSIRRVENASQVKEATTEPWTMASRMSWKWKVDFPVAARWPARAPRKESPAPVGSATSSSGKAEQRKKVSSRRIQGPVAGMEKSMAPNSPSLMTTFCGPLSSRRWPASMRLEVAVNSRASASLMTKRSTCFNTS